MPPVANAQAAKLRGIWDALPDGPLSEEELDERIVDHAGLAWRDPTWGTVSTDYALAQALRSSLVIAQALVVRRGDDGGVTYEKSAEFPEHPPNNGPGTEPFNEELRRRHEFDLRELDRQRQQELEDSPWGQQRRELIRLVEETVDRRIGEVLREYQPVLARVRARLMQVPDDAA